MSELPSRRTVIGAGALGAALVACVGVGAAFAAEEGTRGLRVIAELVAKPGSADDLRKLLVPFAQGARSEPNCLHYTLLEVQGDPGHFMTYEVWTDAAALDAHMKAPGMMAAGPKIVPLLAKPFSIVHLDALT